MVISKENVDHAFKVFSGKQDDADAFFSLVLIKMRRLPYESNVC